MLFGKAHKKTKSKRSKKLARAKKEERNLRKALVEDPSVRRECRTAADAEDIYDEDDFID